MKKHQFIKRDVTLPVEVIGLIIQFSFIVCAIAGKRTNSI